MELINIEEQFHTDHDRTLTKEGKRWKSEMCEACKNKVYIDSNNGSWQHLNLLCGHLEELRKNRL